MNGNRVRVITNDGYPGSGAVTGVLHKLDAAGAIVYRECSLPEGQGNVFIPAHRIREIVDLGRSSL